MGTKEESLKIARVYQFSSFVDFLKSYYAAHSARQPNFNYTHWSKKLNLPNPASLTRILNGDRLPGPKLIEALCEYFAFTQDEKDYFTTLVRLEKETEKSVRDLYHSRLIALKEAESGARPIEPIVTLDAHMLLIWGAANPQKFNEYLDPFGFEGILGYGATRSAVCLKGAYTFSSSIGPYPEFNFACYAKRKGTALGEFEMFVDKIYCSNRDVIANFRSWGSPYEFGEMDQSLTPDTSPLRFSLRDKDGEVVRFSMGKSEKSLSQGPQPNDVFGYNPMWGRDRAFKMSLNSTAHFREFDPAVDVCTWRKDSDLGQLLEKIEFQPSYWTYHPDFEAVIFPLSVR